MRPVAQISGVRLAHQCTNHDAAQDLTMGSSASSPSVMPYRAAAATNITPTTIKLSAKTCRSGLPPSGYVGRCEGGEGVSISNSPTAIDPAPIQIND